MNTITTLFTKAKIDYSWSFSDKTRKDTSYITHGYHRYPAKFIPQIVSRLAQKYTREGDLIVDPFGGCGTTLVESKVMGRPSIAVDINPVAVLITKAKITPIGPKKIEKALNLLKENLNIYSKDTMVKAPEHEIDDVLVVKVKKMPVPNYDFSYGLSLVKKKEVSNKNSRIYNNLAPWGKSNAIKNPSLTISVIHY